MSKRENSLLVLCTERFWPAHGGVERYAMEIGKALEERWSVLVLTAVRRDVSLQRSLLSSRGPARVILLKPLRAEVVMAGLNSPMKAWFRLIISFEDLVHRVALRHYYKTRALALRETARLMAASLQHLQPAWAQYTRVVLHAMGPWEMSLVGDMLFPTAARVTTPFIHPGHWGEDTFSREWFQDRDYVIAIGEEDRKACRAAGVSSDRLRVLPVMTRTPEPFADSSPRRTVLFLGVARPYKGVEVFVEMARRLAGHDLQWVWAGPIPSEATTLASNARSYGVDVKGPISEAEKLRLLQRTLCVCLPSETEITPYCILEAWAAGASVVATDDKYMREFVGGAGLLAGREPAAFGDAVLRLAQEPGLAREHVRLGTQLLRTRHDPAKIGSLLDELYDTAVVKREQELRAGGAPTIHRTRA